MRFALACLIPSVALAQTVAPIDMGFSETIAGETRERLWAQLGEGLAEEGFTLLPEAGVQSKLIEAAIPMGCIVGPCLVEVGKVLSAEYVLIGIVEGIGSSFDVVITVMETDAGLPVAQAIERCDVCSMMDVEESVRRAAINVAAALELHANPPPLPNPVVIAEPPSPPPRLWRWPGWKWVSLGVGAVAAGVGTYLVQIDGCKNDACTNERNTGTAGMLAVGSGVVMMGGAGYLFAFGF